MKRRRQAQAASNEEFAGKLTQTGHQLILSETAEFATPIKEELARIAALIKTLNIAQ